MESILYYAVQLALLRVFSRTVEVYLIMLKIKELFVLTIVLYLLKIGSDIFNDRIFISIFIGTSDRPFYLDKQVFNSVKDLRRYCFYLDCNILHFFIQTVLSY